MHNTCMCTRLHGEGEVTFVCKEFVSGQVRAGRGVRHSFILK